MTHKSHSAIPFERVRGLTHIPPKSIFSRFKGKRAVRTNIAFDKSAFLRDNRKVLISCTRWRRNSSRTFRHLSIYLPVLFSRFFPLLPRFSCFLPAFLPLFSCVLRFEIPLGEAQSLTGLIFRSRTRATCYFPSHSLFLSVYPFLVVCTLVRASSAPHDQPRILLAFDISSRIFLGSYQVL